jgi:WD40 repeat protein
MRAIFGRQYALVFPPSQWKPVKVSTRPKFELQKRRVFGMSPGRSVDRTGKSVGLVKNALHWISDDEFMYPAAALCVVAKLGSVGGKYGVKQEKYFDGHDTDVACLAWCRSAKPDGAKLAASGQSDTPGVGGPYVCVWEPDRPEAGALCELHFHRRAVTAVEFSPSGETLVSIGADDAFMMAIWRGFRPTRFEKSGVKRTSPTQTISTGSSMTHAIYLDPESKPDNFSFSTVGEGSFKVYTVQVINGKDISLPPPSRGVFGSFKPAKNPMSIFYTSKCSWMTGDNGWLFCVKGGSCTHGTDVAKGVPLTCVTELWEERDGRTGKPVSRFCAGDARGNIYIGSAPGSTPKVEYTGNLKEWFSPDDENGTAYATKTSFRICDIVRHGFHAFVFCSNNILVFVDLKRKRVLEVLQDGHTGEAWGLAHHPVHSLCVTGGDDKQLRFWNLADQKPMYWRRFACPEAVYCLCFGPSGKMLAVGMGPGVVAIFGFPAFEEYYFHRVSQTQERISDVAFSPSGKFLAAACWDQSVYLLKMEKVRDGMDPRTGAEMFKSRGKLIGKLTGNSSSALHVMFSKDSQFVMSHSKDTQILYWSTLDGARKPSAAMFRDTEWQTWTGVLGFPVIGIWSDPDYDQTDINAVCQTPETGRDGGKHIAVGDDLGRVKLFKFPCPELKPEFLAYRGHSSHVTNVRFAPNGSILVSLGGNDGTVMQWALEEPTKVKKEVREIKHPWLEVHPERGPIDDVDVFGLGTDGASRHFVPASRAARPEPEEKNSSQYEWHNPWFGPGHIPPPAPQDDRYSGVSDAFARPRR